MFKKTLLLLASLPLALLARKGNEEPTSIVTSEYEPWFTGPLLAPSAHVVPVGHQNIEPYVYVNQTTALYNPHWKAIKVPTFTNVLTQIPIQIGVLPSLEFDIAPQFSYNNTLGVHSWAVNDLPITLAFQLYTDIPETWYPAVKLRVGFDIPIGKYDELDILKLGTDLGGLGIWIPSVGFVFSRVINVYGDHYLAWRFFGAFAWGTSVRVHGLSAYGGFPDIGPFEGTNGTVYPGNSLVFIQGLEYSLTQNWVLALDIQYVHTNKRRFKGFSPLGTEPTHPSNENLSLAPAIEYNFNGNIGIIFGPWFTVAGRNSLDYFNWVLAINVYH
jgi:hypothetical protein